MKISRNRKLSSLLTLLVTGMLANASQAQDDDSIEGLYQKAVEQNMSGQPAEASKTFDKLFSEAGGTEHLFEDYGAQAGGFFFDYGLTLLPQQRWEDAKAAFTVCVTAEEIAERVETPIKSKNARKSLATFQLGFCEAQLGNHEEALKLYDEYIASNPAADEMNQVYGTFKLRYGTSLVNLGREAEGVAVIQELFDNQESKNISSQFLVQGLLALGLAWVEDAKAAGDDGVALEKVSDAANSFLDANEAKLTLSPLDSYRFGFYGQLRVLGFQASNSGLYPLALRIFAMVPTLEDVKKDINLGLARQPLGADPPSQYQILIDRIQAAESAEFHPDAEMLRLVANCYDRMGNPRAARVVYWSLAEQFPDVPAAARGEILHEASRLSSIVGDYSAAQYFGQTFNREVPEDNPLRNNVSSFMLQSLFAAKDYDQVKSIAERVRDRYEPGAPERELADSYYALALFTTQMHEEAAGPMNEYIKAYPEGQTREMVMYFRGTNSLVLGKMREAAEYLEDFLNTYPDSAEYLDKALADLNVARFNLEDYSAAITASERLEEARPDSPALGRTQNIKGDSYLIQAGTLKSKEQEEQRIEWEKAALDSYLAAIESAKAAMVSEPDRADYHKNIAAEGLWKSADQYYTNGEIEKGLAQYDAFFPDYAGTRWEPQISVFSLEHLEAADRGEEGLAQVEKMILFLGNQPPEEQDLTLLRQAIGSYAQASVRIRGFDQTLATLDDFPGVDPSNQALQTWLKIQQVIVLQSSRKEMEKDSPEYAAVEGKIAQVFDDLKKFEIRQLSEFALQQIGLYFSGTDNPFLGVPYFDELLARTNPEADPFKGAAEMELGIIEMRAADPAKIQSARERFRRVIDKYKDASLVPDAYLNLAKLHMNSKEWRDAFTALDVINKKKNYFKENRAKRAEAGFLLGTVLDEMGEPAEANQAYVAVMGAYGSFYDWVTQAWERYIPNSIEDIEAMPAGTEEEIAAKRARQLALYRLSRKYLYSWQDLTDEDSPSGALRRLRRDIDTMKSDLAITPEEEQQVLIDLGLADPN
ncbi:MAG: tetratricopeptide repeat protein [Verrucomicrobiales bacterium]|nr:tetratricopeptide repeat protein [Verrucomicrobiales bacterium]